MIDELPLFLATTSLVLAVPGPDFVVVTRNTLAGSRRRGYQTVLGICAGLSALTLCTAVGVAAVIAANPAVLTTVRLLGGGYLLTLASALAVSAWRRSRRLVEEPASPPVAGSPLRQGFLGNVLNPKALVFYLTFIPQFVTADQPVLGQTLLLGMLVVLCAAVWWTGYVTAIGALGSALRRASVRTAIDASAAVVLGGLGISALLTSA